MRPIRSAVLLAGVPAACGGPQNALDPRGPAASSIEQLWWVLFAIAAAVSVIVVILLLLAVRQAGRRRRGTRVAEINGRTLVLVGGVVAPVVILLSVLVYNFGIGRAVYAPLDREADALTVEVTGHQFWWEVRYPEYGFTTANEIRIPAGRRVRFVLASPDVIHSFWVPQLHGKMDMIPGRMHTLYAEASEPGLFRGQCAEFCGDSHALMAFWVEALPPEEFARWAEARATPAVEPPDSVIAAGREVFLAVGCGDCHATRGAPLPSPLGDPAPDLSDLASRRALAAGTIPNTRESLRDWISDPQRIKPGVHMPPTALEPAELRALLTYLESLR